jgi:gliding motility-associated-like protein
LTFDWSGGITGDTLIANLDPGHYHVVVTDANGCSISDTFDIEGEPVLHFSVDPEHIAMTGDSVFVEIMGDTDEPGLSIEWFPTALIGCPGCIASNVFVPGNLIVTIAITDAGGCIYWLETVINVVSDTSSADEIYAPNVFSPNQDNVNDYWNLVSKDEATFVNHLSLFDRWGELVFHREDLLLKSFDGWDGTLRGKTMNPAVFVYTAEVTLADGRRVRLKGDVTLIR